jgi:ubiquinone/menaquinone biosynthesis C-methylase UbiE
MTMTSETMTATEVKTAVREKYGEAARKVLTGAGAASCGPSSGDGCGCGCDPISSDLYDPVQVAGVPEDAVLASLGCGNPTALAELKPGEVVLDLGSGGGIDVLLSARRVGPTGKAYGLDTTDDMLALAERNKAKSGLTNVEFLRGDIERIPLPDASVDVIISNCVINLSADKDRVLAEAFRVLKPGGRFAVSDVVIRGEVAPEVRRSMEQWVGCVAGALEIDAYRAKLSAAGFSAVDLEVTREYDADGRIASAFIRATRPAEAKSCCGPTCCH